MKITFELPEYDNAWQLSRFREDEGPVIRWCHACAKRTNGPMVRFARLWWHVSCLEETFAWRAVQDSVLSAWLLIAIDVARYPSKHTAAEIKAVIQNLIAGPMMTALWNAGKEEAAGDLREPVEGAGRAAQEDHDTEGDGRGDGHAAVAHQRP